MTGHDALVPADLVIGDERDKATAERERKRKPNRKSVPALVKIAKANDLAVTKLNADGSVSTAPKGEADQPESVTPLDAWKAKRHAR